MNLESQCFFGFTSKLSRKHHVMIQDAPSPTWYPNDAPFPPFPGSCLQKTCEIRFSHDLSGCFRRWFSGSWMKIALPGHLFITHSMVSDEFWIGNSFTELVCHLFFEKGKLGCHPLISVVSKHQNQRFVGKAFQRKCQVPKCKGMSSGMYAEKKNINRNFRYFQTCIYPMKTAALQMAHLFVSMTQHDA